MNTTCSLLPVALFLDDHKAETLQAVVDAAQAFASENQQEGIRFALAAGNAGIEAATNQEIAVAQTRMMLLIYGVVCAWCSSVLPPGVRYCASYCPWLLPPSCARP